MTAVLLYFAGRNGSIRCPYDMVSELAVCATCPDLTSDYRNRRSETSLGLLSAFETLTLASSYGGRAVTCLLPRNFFPSCFSILVSFQASRTSHMEGGSSKTG